MKEGGRGAVMMGWKWMGRMADRLAWPWKRGSREKLGEQLFGGRAAWRETLVWSLAGVDLL